MYACVCDWLGFSYREEVQWVSVSVRMHTTHFLTHTPGGYSSIWLAYFALSLFPPPPFIACLTSSFLRLHKNLPVSLSDSLCISLASLILYGDCLYDWIMFQIGCGYNLSDTRHQGIEFTRLQSSWPQVSFFLSFLSLLILLSELPLSVGTYKCTLSPENPFFIRGIRRA